MLLVIWRIQLHLMTHSINSSFTFRLCVNVSEFSNYSLFCSQFKWWSILSLPQYWFAPLTDFFSIATAAEAHGYRVKWLKHRCKVLRNKNNIITNANNITSWSFFWWTPVFLCWGRLMIIRLLFLCSFQSISVLFQSISVWAGLFFLP